MRLAEMEARDRCNEGAEPENPVVETEKGDTLTRLTYKNGYTGWVSERIKLSEHDQDALEEAYELGRKANDAQLKNLSANMKDALVEAQANGAFQAAVTAYTRERR